MANTAIGGAKRGSDTVAVKVEGLRELRTAIRNADKKSLVVVRQVLRAAANIVAIKAKEGTPVGPGSKKHAPGRLRDSIKPSTSAAAAIVRSTLPYAAVQEWGGTIRPRGVDIKIERHNMVWDAAQKTRDEVEVAIMTGLDKAAAQAGWK